MNTFNKIPATLKNIAYWCMGAEDKEEFNRIKKNRFYDDLTDKVFACNAFQFNLVLSIDNIHFGEVDCDELTNTMGALLLSEFDVKTYFFFIDKLVFQNQRPSQIPISVHFYQFLWHNGYIKKMLKTKTLHDMRKLLLLGGDIEANPGPVDYKTSCRNRHYRSKHSKSVEQLKLELSYKRAMRTCKEEERVEDPEKRIKVEMQIFNKVLLGGTTAAAMYGAYKLKNNFETNADTITNTITETLQTFRKSMKDVSQYMVKGIDTISLVGDIIFSLLHVYMAKAQYKLQTLSIELCRMLLKYGVPNGMLDDFRNYAHKTIYEEVVGNNIQARMQIDMPASLNDIEFNPTHIVIFLLGILSLVFTQALPKPTFTEGVLKRLGDLGRSAKGIKDLGSVTHEMITVGLEEFKVKVLGQRPQQEIETFISGIDEWFDQVRSFLERREELKKSDDILRKPEIIIEVENLYKRGLEYSKEISEKKLNQKLSVPFNMHMKYLTDLLKMVDTSGAFGTRPRTQPVVIWLYGESGVGKSGMSWPLAIDLNNMFVPNAQEAKEFSKNIYMRNVEQEFWDNYQGQNVVIYDDFGQRKDGASTPNEEFMELIRTANIAPYPLHMAHLEDKRKARFTSKIVMLTSNVFNHVVNSLTFPDAFRRRVDLCARVYNKDEFTKAGYSKTSGMAVQRLDKQKVQRETGKIISTDVYLMDLVDPESEATIAEGLTYDEFLELAQQKTREAFSSSIKMNEFLEDYAEERYRKGVHMQIDLQPQLITLEQAEIDISNAFSFNFKDKIFNKSGESVDITETIIEDTLKYDGVSDYTTFMNKIYDNIKKTYYVKVDPLITKLKMFKNIAMTSLKEYAREAVRIVTEHPMAVLSSLLLILSGIFVMTKVYNRCFSSMINEKVLNVDKAQLGCVAVKLAEENKEYNDVSGMKPHHVIQFLPSILENPRPILVDKVNTNLVSALNSVGENLDVYVKEPHFSYNGKKFNLEASVSGDPNTLKTKTVKVEASASGDPITCKPKNIKVEASASGDPNTLKPKIAKFEAVVSGDPQTLKPQKPKVEREIQASMQMWKDQVAQNIINNRILSNLYKISVKRGDREMPLLNGLFVRATNMLVPGHLIGFLCDDDIISLTNLFEVRFEIPWKDVIVNIITDRFGDSKEAALLTFPRYVHQHSDLVKHFSDGESMSMYRTADTCIPTIRFSDKLRKFVLTILGNQTARCLDRVVTLCDDEKGDFYLRQGLEYKCPTKNGDCGSPVVINETRVLRKIAGIHVAGADDGTAYAESVTQNDLERVFKKIPVNMQIETDFDGVVDLIEVDLPFNQEVTEDLILAFKLPSKCFTPLGRVEPLFEPNQTEIRPSLVHGQITDIKTKPAYLKYPGINMKHKNLAKSALNTPYISKEIIDRAYTFVKAKWFQGRDERLARVLTWDECIVGSSDSEYIGPINRQSSPGYPWIKQRQNGFKGKTQWFGNDENYFFSEDILEACKFREEQAAKGIRLPTIWVDTLKDERRPIEKVNALKTRVFSNGPMDYTIVFRKYFLGFVAHLMENRISNEVSIGTNVYSRDWGKTARKLQEKGSKVIAGDFSTFDGTLNSCMMEKFVQLVNEFYDDGPRNALIRETLFLDVFNSVHLCDGIIYMTTHSQPSGNPVTTPLNCFINSMGLRMCFEECARGTKYSMSDFDKHVSMVSYGDDNVINFSDVVAPFFNMTTITSAFSKFGYIYTDEAKTLSGDIPRWRDLSEVAYLKRNFKYDHNRQVWNAPLSLDTILETPNWMRGELDAETGTKVNCEVSIMELSLHDKETFEHWTNKIDKAYLKTTGQTLEHDSYLGYWHTRYMDYYL